MKQDQLRMMAIEALMESNPHANRTLDPANLDILSEKFTPSKNPSRYSVVLREGYHFVYDIAPKDRLVPVLDSGGDRPLSEIATKQAISLASQLGVDIRKVKAERSATGKVGVKDIFRVSAAGEAQFKAKPKPKPKAKSASKPKAEAD
jgi:hypothetical protein